MDMVGINSNLDYFNTISTRLADNVLGGQVGLHPYAVYLHKVNNTQELKYV
jgi:hypothetical protein